jgi:hypothetical protein
MVKPFPHPLRISDQGFDGRTMMMDYSKRELLRVAGLAGIALTFGCGGLADARKGKLAITKRIQSAPIQAR